MLKKAIIIAATLLASTTAYGSSSMELQDCDQANSDEICASLYNQLNKMSKKGNPAAATMMGVLYSLGDQGVPQDHEKAMKLFKKAARKNVPVAQFELAKYYLLGEHVEADREQAEKLLKSASRLNYSEATLVYNILQLEKPDVSEEEKAEFVAEIKKLRFLSPENADNFLGRYYLKTGKRDIGVEHLRKASKRGHKEAQQMLAKLNIDQTAFPDAEANGFERIVITSAAVDVNEVARELLRFAKSSSMFNGKSTGSRVPGQSCILDGSCAVLSSRADLQRLNNILGGVAR